MSLDTFIADHAFLGGLMVEVAGAIIDKTIISKAFEKKDPYAKALQKVFYTTSQQFRGDIPGEEMVYRKPFFTSPVLARALTRAAMLDEQVDELKLLNELSSGRNWYMATPENLSAFINQFKENAQNDPSLREVTIKATYPFKIFSIHKNVEQIIERISAEDKDCLQLYTSLSSNAFEDAQQIEKASPWSAVRKYITLDNLYVDRDLQTEVMKEIAADAPGSILLVSGEAGFGKTSLLWKLFQEIRSLDGYHPVFLKSVHLKRLDIARLIRIIYSLGKKPAILVDTIDLLLHNDNDREILLVTLRAAAESGALFIGTTRPQELEELKPFEASLGWKKLVLGAYDPDTELPKAIAAYSKVYNEKEPLETIEQNTQAILESVSNNSSLRNICLTPLTQRMLFSMYAPGQIVTEINVFKLYKKYWSERVEKDVRPGKAGQASHLVSETDLSSTACFLSLLMISEGNTVVQLSRYETTMQEHGIMLDYVLQLAARGIIHYHESDSSVEFFHQTFFEHTAARALLIRLKKDAIAQLKNRLTAETGGQVSNNYFLIPVYQQLLLLSETSSFRQMMVDEMMVLLKSRDIHQLVIFAYVYSLLEEDYTEMMELLLTTINEYGADETTFLKRLLQVSANIKSERIGSLMRVLRNIWVRHIYNEQHAIIELLNDLAGRSPEQVRNFLKDSDSIDAINRSYAEKNRKEHKDLFVKVASVLAKIYHIDPSFALEQLQRIFEDNDGVINKEIFKVLLTLKHFDSQKVLVPLAYTASITGFSHSDTNEMPEEVALLLGQWKAGRWFDEKVDCATVLKEINTTVHKNELIPLLVAFADYATTLTDAESDLAFKECKNQKASNLFLWCRWMVSNIWKSKYIQCRLSSLQLEDARNAIAKRLEDPSKPQELDCRSYLTAIERTDITGNAVLIEHFSSIANNRHNWSVMQELVRFFVSNFDALPEAQQVFSEADKAFFIRNKQLGKQIWQTIGEEKIDNPKLELYAMEVLFACEETKMLSHIIQQIHNDIGLQVEPHQVPEHIVGIGKRLAEYALLHSSIKQNDERVHAAHLYHGLCKLGLAVIDRNGINRYFPYSTYPQMQSWIVEIWGFSSFDNMEELVNILEELIVYLESPVGSIVYKAQYSVFRLISRARFDCSPLEKRISSEIYSRNESDGAGQKFKFVNRMVVNQCLYNTGFAYHLLSNLLTSELLLGFNDKKQRSIGHELRNSSVQLCAKGDTEIRAKFAALLESATCEYGRLILDGLTFDTQVYTELQPILNKIVGSGKARQCIQYQIANQIRGRFSMLSSSGWEDILA